MTFNLLNVYPKEQGRDSLLIKKIIAMIDSLSSPAFDDMYVELKKEVDELDNEEVSIELLQLQVYNNYLKGNTDSLLHYAEILKNKFLDNNSSIDYYQIWSYVVNHYTLTGKMFKAITESTNMLTVASSQQDLSAMGLSRQLLGEIYLYLDLYDESIIQLQKSYEYTRNSGASSHALSSLCFSMNLAYIYNKDYNSVFEICNTLDSLNVVSDTIKNVLPLKAYNLISMCCRTIAYCNLGKLDEAKSWFNLASDSYKECNMQHDFFLETEAVYNYVNGNYKKSLEAYGALYDLYKELGLQKESLRILKEITDINGKLGNYKEAYSNYELYERIKDSLSIDMAYQHLNELTISNDMKNIELEKKNLQLQIQETRSNYLKILILFFIVITVTILYYLVRERRLNHKLTLSKNSLKEEKIALARSEEMLLMALEKSKQAEIIKSSFLSNISHEIRTPLNSIVGFSDMIVDCEDSAERQMYSNIIKTNNELLLKLIDDIILISKTEAESTKRDISNFDIVKVFDDIYEKNKNKVGNKVKFINEVKYDKLVVSMDKTRLTQIVVNFISNAIKFTDKGYIKLGLEPDLKGLKIYVSDTGIGIKDEDKTKIFDKFYKVNDYSQGSGLGITLCKALTDECGGKIGVESQYGHGSTFYVYIPCDILDIEEEVLKI